MKKRGFTLSEIIITLGIIGVVAAITTPMLTGLMPDKNKVQVLKVHKTISDITKDLLKNPYFYHDYIEEVPSTFDIKRIGLGAAFDFYGDVYAGLKGDLDLTKYKEKYHGLQKYCYLLSEQMELEEEVTENNQKYFFKTIDGVSWACEYDLKSEIVDDYRYITPTYFITVDLNGEEQGLGISYPDSKKPDQFKFLVDTYGNVTGNDPLTKAYLENPEKLNDKKKDYARAEEISNGND